MGVVMNEKQQLRQIAKLGIEDFETLEDVERMQSDMLRRLHKSQRVDDGAGNVVMLPSGARTKP